MPTKTLNDICHELDALCTRMDARSDRIDNMLAECIAAINSLIEKRRHRDAVMNDRPDPWEMAVEAGLARDFAHDLEALVCTTRTRGLSDEMILAKVREVADALREGVT
jgi:hypothetical protein